MNSPTHLIAGAVVAQAVMTVINPRASRSVQVMGVLGCLALGMASHLLLDLIPHYNWVVYVNWLRQVPYGWLLRQLIFSLPILCLAAYCSRDRPVLGFLGLLGCMYPDLEKVAYFDFHMPAGFVLFPWHSMQFSGWDGRKPMTMLIAEETTILIVLALLTAGLSWRRLKKSSKAVVQPDGEPLSVLHYLDL